MSKLKSNIRLGKPHSAVYFVKDIVNIKQWYSNILNIEPYRADRNFVGFELQGTNLCFHRSDKKSGTTQGSQIIYWSVKDVDETAALLLSNGASWFRKPIAIPEGGKVCQIQDPFNNIIGLAETK